LTAKNGAYQASYRVVISVFIHVWGERLDASGRGGKLTPLEILGANVVAISNGVKRRFGIKPGRQEEKPFLFSRLIKQLCERK
jgi:hypothetical protein